MMAAVEPGTGPPSAVANAAELASTIAGSHADTDGLPRIPSRAAAMV